MYNSVSKGKGIRLVTQLLIRKVCPESTGSLKTQTYLPEMVYQ